jgi:hypothetical protein
VGGALEHWAHGDAATSRQSNGPWIGGRTSLNRSASVLVAEGQPARLLGLIDSTSAFRERQSNRPNHAGELR